MASFEFQTFYPPTEGLLVSNGGEVPWALGQSELGNIEKDHCTCLGSNPGLPDSASHFTDPSFLETRHVFSAALYAVQFFPD
jgi:hypothetical protein